MKNKRIKQIQANQLTIRKLTFYNNLTFPVKGQITKEQAIWIYDSGMWKDWTPDQIVRFQLFQDRLAIPFAKFHEAIEKVLGRSVFTHELGLNYEGIVKEYLGAQDAPTMDEIINLIPPEKRIIMEI